MFHKILLAVGLTSLILMGCKKSGQDVPIPAPVPTVPPESGQPQAPQPEPAPAPVPPDTRLSNPANDPNFLKLKNGTDLSSIKVSGSKLSPQKGAGSSWTSALQVKYVALRDASIADPKHDVQWMLMDLDQHKVIAQSAGAANRQFGASTAKVYTAATLLDHKGGVISSSQLQLMSEMLVVSSNTAWVELQKQTGDGNAEKGRERNYAFTQRMGYLKTKGFQGTWSAKKMHGNELVASELAETLHDIYWAKFPGAETQWKIMYTCRTGASRGRRYLPSSVYVGGKTGTYDGPTEVDGKSVKVRVRNHAMTLNYRGHQYAITVLANTGSDESAAIMAGGLFKQYIDKE